MAVDETQQHRSIWSVIGEQPGLLISLSYLLISLLGVFFTWSMYHRLGVDYLEFAEVTDFLMAVLREPITLLLAGTAVLVTVLLRGMITMEQRYFARNPPKNVLLRAYKRTSDWSYRNIPLLEIIAFLLYSFLFVSLYGEWKSNGLRAGEGRQVSVQLVDESGELQRTLLGDSSRYLFLFDTGSNQVEAIPHENIMKLTMVVSAPQQGRQNLPEQRFPARPVKPGYTEPLDSEQTNPDQSKPKQP